MKKIRHFLSAFLLILTLLFVGCAGRTKPVSSNIPKDESNTYFYITEESDKNLISIQVPVVTTENAQHVNVCIKEAVYDELQHWLSLEECNLKEDVKPIENVGERIESSEYSAQYLHISSCISYESEEYISIVFTGRHNVKSAAHPNEVFFSVNVDVKSAQRIGLADTNTVDDTLYTAFLQYVHSDRIAHDELLALNVFEKGIFLEGLNQEPEKGLYSYYTPTKIGISYPVPFALGNYILAEIPRDFLRGQGGGAPVP